jgi:protein required for attachment to host cells
MSRICIAVVDASRARLLLFDRSVSSGRTEEHLTEIADFANPARRTRPSQLFSDSRPGSSRTGHLQYAFDDHRDAHVDRMDAEFAQIITAEIARILRAEQATQVIVCASSRMLDKLRACEPRLHVSVEEVPHDLTQLRISQLRDRLASYGVLPPRPTRPGLESRGGHP